MSRRRGLLEITLVVAAVDAYELARRAMRPDWPRAVGHAHDVLALERALHVDWERGAQSLFLHAPVLVDVLDVVYLGSHFVVTAAFFVWLYRRVPGAYLRFRDTFLAATALALVVHWQFPVAPPRLAGIGVEDTVRSFTGFDIGSPASAALTDPVAALPSLHVAWAVGVGAGLVLYGRSRGWRVAGALYAPLVALATVVTGNHFVLDGVAGIAVLCTGFWLVETLWRPQGGTLPAASRGGAVR